MNRLKNIPYKLLVRYLVAGVTGLLVNISILYLCTEYIKLWYVVSSIIAFSLATGVSFLLQKFWTFQNVSLEQAHKQFVAFLGLALINVLINTYIVFLLVSKLHVWYIGGQVVASGLIAFESLIVYKYGIFQ